jgi:uncharacterized membrane-anchored protein
LRQLQAACAAIVLCVAAPAFAENPAPVPAPVPAGAAAPDLSWQDKLNRQTGVVTLLGSGARLNLGQDYYFLDAADSKKVLVEGWGNPPGSADGVLGMIFPARFKPLDEAAWGAVVSYEDVGYVADKDARDTDYDTLLNDLRKTEDDDNAARQKAGYSPVHLVGWAERPTYDAGRHVVIWARDLKFGDTEHDTLNYDIRVLGRRGVLSLNVVSSLSDLAEVKAAASQISSTAAFESGSAYADYRKGGDKVAEYGVAGLIAAGVGAVAVKKLGLLAILLVVLKKGIVVVVAAFASIGAWFRKTFLGKKDVGVGKKASADASPPPKGPDLIS